MESRNKLDEKLFKLKISDLPMPKQKWKYEDKEVLITGLYTHPSEHVLWVSFIDNEKNRYLDLAKFISLGKKLVKRGRPKKELL